MLAGFLAGLLAQRPLAATPATAVRFAVWQHGAAADALPGTGAAWVPEELVPALGAGRP